MDKKYSLDIIVPVYNEGQNITGVLDSLNESVDTPFRMLVCYDHDEDNTLGVVKDYSEKVKFPILLVKNQGRGAGEAVITGFRKSEAAAVIVLPADDDYNARIIDLMYEKFGEGSDIVSASRFLRGGCMKGCPLLKSVLVRTASFTLYWLAGIPSHDATNGFRLFSRRVLDQIDIESREGFTYSLELLVKAHRRGYRIEEVPAFWFERKEGKSRFRLGGWLPHYIRWYMYGIATRMMRLFPREYEEVTGK